jgi:hypothetical protein
MVPHLQGALLELQIGSLPPNAHNFPAATHVGADG